MLKRTTIDEVERMLRTLPRGTYTTEDLLIRLRARLPTLSYHQLKRILERLAEQGKIEKLLVKVFYVDPRTHRRYPARRTMWRL